MNCKRAKLHIALLIGDDLDDTAQAELQSHLSECIPCRDYHQSMIAAPRALQQFEEWAAFQPHDSLWPGLLDKLPQRPGLRMHDFNGWWAALAVAVACLAIGLFWNDEAHSGRWGGSLTVNSPPRKPGPDPLEAVIPRVSPATSGETLNPPQSFFFDRNRRVMIFIPGDADTMQGLRIAPPLRGSRSSDDFDDRWRN